MRVPKVKIAKLYNRKPFNKSAYGKDWSTVSKQQISEDGKCFDCGSINHLHVHHIIPLSKGGTNNRTNRIVLCEGCHSKRHSHMRRKK